jgi:hypothetical protein
MIGALPLFPIVVAGGLAYPFAIDKIQSWLWPAPIPPPAPAAPQTETEMRTWTPELAAERDLANWQAWRPTAIPGGAAAEVDNTLIYAALAVAAIAVWRLSQ